MANQPAPLFQPQQQPTGVPPLQQAAQRTNIELGKAPTSAPPQTQLGGKKVYSMPEKFMPAKSASGGGSKKKKIFIIVGIILAVLIILAAIVVYAFQVSTVQDVVDDTNFNTDVTKNTNVTELNKNTNENSNVNINDNENVNNPFLNPNDNTNADTTFLTANNNENENDNTNGSENSNENTSTTSALEPDQSHVADTRDKDNDKLTDEEEELYETKFHQPDTDKDGYIDGREIISLYSPIKKDQKLIDSGLVIDYVSEEFGWSIYYPSDWIAEAVEEARREVLFTSDQIDGEFVQVLVTDNTNGETAAEWYASLYTDIEPEDLEEVEVGNLTGIVSSDGFRYYLADENYIIGIIYNFGTKEEINFRTSYTMMIESFNYSPKKKKSDDSVDENSNENINTNNNSNSNSNENNNPEQSSSAVDTNENSSSNSNTNADSSTVDE